MNRAVRLGLGLFIILVLCGLWMALPLLAEDPVLEPVPQPQADIDEFARQVMEEQKLVGLALGTVVDGQVDYLRGYGWQDREAEIPVRSRKTAFRWASISKTLTAVLAVQLSGQGLLDLDQPIRKYLTDYQPPAHYLQECDESEGGDGNQPCQDGKRDIRLAEAERSISMRQLLGHLGGVMHYRNGRGSPVPPQSKANDPKTNQGFAWALQYFTEKPLVARPGTDFRYTTFGFNLAGAVIEKAGKGPFAQQLQERIAAPLGLKSLQPDYEWAEIPDRAAGYRLWGVLNVRQGSDDVSWKLPGGGVISTVGDLTNYCKALVGDSFLSEQEKELLWTSQATPNGEPTGYGMGFGVEDVEGRKRVNHGGSQQKAKTYLLAVPSQKSCVTVMSNSVQANPRKIAVGLLDLLEER